MEVTFSWANTKGPDEVTRVTMMLDAVPRHQELVSISLQLPVGSGRVVPVQKEGRVRDVVWHIGNEGSVQKVNVMLGR